MEISKSRKICIYILAIFLLFSSIVLFEYSNNEIIEKEIIKTNKENNFKALDQEGETYRLVTSADNVQVPVPKGYVASQVTGENYVTPEYQHTTITHKVSSTPSILTWSSPAGEAYPWTQDENGIWISGNQGIPNSTSTLESEEFDYIKGTTAIIKYTYSCEYGDYLNIDLINLTNNTTMRIAMDRYGNTHSSFDYTSNETYETYSYTMNNWATGRYKIRAIYRKNGNTNGGQDRGYIKASTYFKEDENGETIEEDIKTKIHDGGFVIYQLTDEELETDPNGTSVIINDTNKDEAQSTRNQYVWVPVENVEDLVRTKTINNGIMQFGQNYSFSNTSITKDTSTETNYYREPRLVEDKDKTKYYLQRYSNLDKRENYLNEQQKDFTKMIKSINKYKGFYIGRYETGDEYSHNASKKCFTSPRVVRYNSNINYVTWYDSYKDLQRLSGKTEKYVETGMLYDSLWGYTLKWLNETDTRSYKDIYSDSGTWGNYDNISFKYKSSANGAESTKNTNSSTRTPTGGITQITFNGETYSDSPTASNNIFDIAGNVWEWTRSRNSTDARRYRGSSCGNDSSSSPGRYVGNDSPYNSNYYLGVRGQLYIL